MAEQKRAPRLDAGQLTRLIKITRATSRYAERDVLADAMLDRLMQNHHRFTLTGESLRKKAAHTKAKAD